VRQYSYRSVSGSDGDKPSQISRQRLALSHRFFTILAVRPTLLAQRQRGHRRNRQGCSAAKDFYNFIERLRKPLASVQLPSRRYPSIAARLQLPEKWLRDRLREPVGSLPVPEQRRHT
jgi:hypothetical protein